MGTQHLTLATPKLPNPLPHKVSLFCVSVSEINHLNYYHDVLVVASNIREARRLGVDACESKGLINRESIRNTLVYKTEKEVFQYA